jgi:hypothetical protein
VFTSALSRSASLRRLTILVKSSSLALPFALPTALSTPVRRRRRQRIGKKFHHLLERTDDDRSPKGEIAFQAEVGEWTFGRAWCGRVKRETVACTAT